MVAPTPKRMMWRVTEAPWRMLQRSLCCSFAAFCGVQLVLRSGVLTVLDLDEVDVAPSFVEVFRSVLSGVGGCTISGWRSCWGAPSLPQLPPATPKNPPPYISLLFLCFCSDGSNKHKIWAVGKSVFIWELGWEEPFGNYSTFSCFRIWRFCMVIRSLLSISMETMHDPKEPVFLIALRVMWHAMLCLSVIMFLICVCWHPERMCRALSTCGQRGQVWLVESLNNTAFLIV